MRSFFRKVLGILSIALGIAFGVLPFVPGILLIFVGLELLGVSLVPWEKIKGYWRKKDHPKSDTEETEL